MFMAFNYLPPPWEAYHSVVAGKFVGLEKCPGVKPVGVGEILQRILGKFLLKECGKNVTHSCGVEQLCSRIRSGVEG